MIPRPYRSYRYRKPRFYTPLNRRHPMAQGLVGCWLINEGSRNTLYDLSGHNNVGTLANMADPPTATSGWGIGQFGSVLGFDGSNDYCSIPLLQNYPISIAMLFRPSSKAASYGLISFGFDFGQDKGIYLQLQHASPAPHLQLFIGNTILTIVSLFVYDVWQYLVLTIDTSGNYIVYLDAVPRGDGVETNAGLGVASFIGSENASQNYSLIHLDHVYVYDRVLANQEVDTLYQHHYTMFEQPWKRLYGGVEAPAAAGKTPYVFII